MPRLRPLPHSKPMRWACMAAMLPPVARGAEAWTLSVRALLWVKHAHWLPATEVSHAVPFSPTYRDA